MKHYSSTANRFGAPFLCVGVFFITFFIYQAIAYRNNVSAQVAANLIGNPSVETASTSPSNVPLAWFKGGWGTNTRTLSYPVPGFDGTKAVRTEITSYASGDAKWYFEPVPVSGGEQYTFSDRYRSNTGSTLTIRYQLANGSFSYPDIAVDLPASTAWTSVSRTFTVPTNLPSPVVNMTVFHLIKSVGWVEVDLAALTESADSEPPTVSVSAPPNPLSGIVSLSANASDNVGVANVRYFLDDLALSGQLTAAPYNFQWDTTGTPDGTHTLIATARDQAGNTATSSIVTVQTANNGSTGAITINVVVINNNGMTKTPSDFPVFVDATNMENGVPKTFPVGTYVVSEIVDPSYTQTISGDCTASGNITLIAEQQASCTIINDDIPPSPPATQTNLINNPSVETASTSPSNVPLAWFKGGWGTNTRTLSYPVAGSLGAKGIRTEITSHTTGDAKWYFEPVNVSPGQQFTFSDSYISNTPSTLTIQYKLADNTFRYTDIAVGLPAAGSFTSVSRTFTVPTFSSPVVKMTVFHLINSVGWLVTDNYSLVTFVPPANSNLIINPSLETRSNMNSAIPEGWAKSVSSGSTANFAYPVAGNNSPNVAKVTITSYTGGAGAKWYPKSVNVSPGKEYLFTNTYQSTTESFIIIQFTHDNGTFSYLDLMRLAPSPSWQTAENTFSTFMVPPHATAVTILHLIKSVGSLTVDNYSLTELPSGKFANGMISLTFDDGPMSVYQNAIPLLSDTNILSTQYIVSGFLDEPGYVTEAQFQNMVSLGHEIGGHTRTHPHLLTLNASELQSEISGGRNDLIALGVTPRSFSYPYGEYNDVVIDAVIQAGYSSARSVRKGFNTKNTNPYDLLDQHVEANTTITDIRKWIDQAITDRTWLILELHDVNESGDTYSTTPAILQATLDYINQQGIEVVSVETAVNRMN